MRCTLDTHTHTSASGHAYNTIDEMAVYAAGHGGTHLAITDHRSEERRGGKEGRSRWSPQH